MISVPYGHQEDREWSSLIEHYLFVLNVCQLSRTRISKKEDILNEWVVLSLFVVIIAVISVSLWRDVIKGAENG